MILRYLCILTAGLAIFGTAAAVRAEGPGRLKVRITWGHHFPQNTPFYVKLLAAGVEIQDAAGFGLEAGDGLRDGAWQTRSGGGDVDGVEFLLRYPQGPPRKIEKLHRIWADLIAQSDPDTARRLRQDPAFRLDARKLTVQMDREGTKGFSVTVDQLLEQRALWVPALDVFVAAGEPLVAFAEHERQLAPWQGKGVLDQVHRDPEATYEQYTARWEDMGSPRYVHPAQPAPGHIVCLGWDSGLHKFGIDRGAGVWSDLGNPDRLRLGFDFGDLAKGIADWWKGQRLTDGLPVITTLLEKDRVRYEVEQFAYPLGGPPRERRGDLPMVLLEKVRISNLEGKPQAASVKIYHRRDLPTGAEFALLPENSGKASCLEDRASHRVFFSVEGAEFKAHVADVPADKAGTDSKARNCEVTVSLDLPENGVRRLVVKLPSPVLAPEDRDKLLALDYDAARKATLQFWSQYAARGAQFRVPEQAVNDLFQANLWHALRLPRRHGGQESNVQIDLPYSNFAYDQRGTPWPVNQAVYVDYMLYDLRGYHNLAAEELAAMYRNNQEPSGHVGGLANWGVYTPGMVYAVAQNYLLSGDRQALDRLLPPTLKALDWCLGEIERGNRREGPSKGLVRGPLNDGTGEGVWAFNQAYVYAALERLATVLEQIGHPRAAECRTAAERFRQAVARGFGAATMLAPLVQLRDHTWVPYVPCEVLTPRRLLEQWYPTDVDTGALHLPRLKALPPDGALTDFLLNDHEDNLYLKGWGMANEPVYNQQATAYLLRDDPQAVVRAFYSYMACAFSHSVFEPVEHRWTWGQYFGPPSTDGAWFELYRNMLIHEQDDDALVLLLATPRKWLADGKRIEVERAPTYYGPLSMTVASHVAKGRIVADISMPDRRRPQVLLVRLRHPEGRPIRTVTVDGRNWTDFDARKEWVRIPNPDRQRYSVVAGY
jgi:hypothetical protein